MAKRKHKYKFGFPAYYFSQSQKPPKGKKEKSDKKYGEEMAERKRKYEAGEKYEFAKKGMKVKRKPISASVKKTLQAKAKKSGKSYGTLVKVYRRGQGAWFSGGSRKGVGMNQWAMGRVNSFLRGSKKHDTDLR